MEIEHLKRYDTAYRFHEAQQLLKQSTEELDEITKRKAELARTIQVSDETVVHLKQNLAVLEKKRDMV
jgi:hypothetical protein